MSCFHKVWFCPEIVFAVVSSLACRFQNTTVASQRTVSRVSEFVTPSPSLKPFRVATLVRLGVSLSTCQTIHSLYWHTPSITCWSASTPAITPSSAKLEHNVASKSEHFCLFQSVQQIPFSHTTTFSAIRRDLSFTVSYTVGFHLDNVVLMTI